MDKLKKILAFLEKWHFWFISAATVIVVLLCWWWSTQTLAKQFQNQKKVIEDQFSGVSAITDAAPNQELIDAVNKKHEELKKGVLEVWKTLYHEQQQNNPWPGVLGADFIAKIKAINELGPNEPIPGELRERYQNFIKDYFPTLEKSIKLREAVDESGKAVEAAPSRALFGRAELVARLMNPMRTRTSYNAESVNMVGVVDWDQADRVKLKERFDWSRTPDSTQVRLAQEDLWVYETLLRVVSETNGGATDQSQAAIKRIDALDIGADAVKVWSDADQAVFRIPAVTIEGGHRPLEASRDISSQSKEQLLTDRYVDDKGAPLAADAAAPFAEFKMMPISMTLLMDQRKITKLLVECATRAMPIEVRRVRLNPGKGEAIDFGLIGTATATTTIPGRLDTGRRPIFDRGRTSRRVEPTRGGTTADEEVGAFDIPVEIQGIIYIYNPPDQATLGTGAAGEKPPEASPAPEAGAPAAAGETAPAAAGQPAQPAKTE